MYHTSHDHLNKITASSFVAPIQNRAPLIFLSTHRRSRVFPDISGAVQAQSRPGWDCSTPSVQYSRTILEAALAHPDADGVVVFAMATGQNGGANLSQLPQQLGQYLTPQGAIRSEAQRHLHRIWWVRATLPWRCPVRVPHRC